MQLSALLARLTPEERAVLLERRLGPNAVALDNQALASQLAQPASLAQALVELNYGQLLLLRWLSARPNLEARWSELVEALGDRLSPELRNAYLLDLRLWGLADSHPTERGGFFATYPAAVAQLPTKRGVRLHQRLPGLNSDVLAKIAGALGLQRLPTRKDSRAALIESTLTVPESCKWAVDRLSPEARALFMWVREESGWVTFDKMNQRVSLRRNPYGMSYGTLDAYWAPPRKDEKLDPLSELVRCALVWPVSTYGASWYSPVAYAIPEEVEMAFSGRTLFDAGPLQPTPLAPAHQVSGTIPNPANLLRDLVHLLGFVATDRCEWRQDGEPYKRSLVAVGKLLGQPGADYPEMLWGMAVAAQLLRPVRRGAGGYAPAVAVDATPRELLDGLLLGWINTGGQAIQPGVLPGVATEARMRLVQLLQLLPPDTWVLRSSLDEWLRFQSPIIFRPDFQTYHTSLPDPGVASLGTLLLALGTTPDGQDAVMIPAAHQQILLAASEDLAGPPDAAVATDSPADDVLPPWDESWIVQPDRSIVAPPNASPNALLDLWQVARLESNQGASVFRVSAESIAAALNRGLPVDEVRSLLSTRSRVPLPPTVERLIEDQGKRYGRIRVGSAHTYVKVDDPALLAELRRDRRLQKLDWRDVAPGVAFVVSSDPAAVLDTLRKAGYLPVPDQDRPKKPAPKLAVSSPGTRGSASTPRRGGSPADMVLRLARTALREERLLYLTWTDRGRTLVGELEVIDLHGREIHANNLDDGEEVLVSADDVIESELGEPLGEFDDIDLSFLDPS